MVGAPNPMIGKTQGYTFRCKLCNHFCKTNAALKSHLTKKKTDGGCKQTPINRSGALAELAVKRLRRQQRQKDFDHVKISDHVLENAEGVPLVSCHRMLEPGSSCRFFSSIFLFGQSDFQVSKRIFDSREILFLELLLLLWSSYYFLELLLGSSIWWRELGETPSVEDASAGEC